MSPTERKGIRLVALMIQQRISDLDRTKTVMSEADASYGSGEKNETNTFIQNAQAAYVELEMLTAAAEFLAKVTKEN